VDIPQFISPWLDLGAGGLVVLFVLSIYFNWLVPRKSVDKLLQVQKDRLNDRDDLIAELRKTNEALDKRNDMLADQVRELVEIGKTSNAAISALPLPERK